MTFADALAATKGPRPITRTTSEGYVMLGYLNGSVDVCRNGKIVKKLGVNVGPTLGYTDWQLEQESMK